MIFFVLSFSVFSLPEDMCNYLIFGLAFKVERERETERKG